MLLPEIALCRGEVAVAVVPALVVPVAGQAAAPSSAHLPSPDQPGAAQHRQPQCEEEQGELELVHVSAIISLSLLSHLSHLVLS